MATRGRDGALRWHTGEVGKSHGESERAMERRGEMEHGSSASPWRQDKAREAWKPRGVAVASATRSRLQRAAWGRGGGKEDGDAPRRLGRLVGLPGTVSLLSVFLFYLLLFNMF